MENIFTPLIDSWFSAMDYFLPLLGKCLNMDFYKGFDFDTYFKNTNLYLQTESEKIYPKMIEHSLSDKEDIYSFIVPNGYGKQKLEQYKDGLELAIGYPIKYEFNKSIWNIIVKKGELKSNIKYSHVYRKNSLKIPVGESLDETLYINLRENATTLICGTIGSGKSVCTKSILTTLINNFNPNMLEITLCDLKKVELNLFKNVNHVTRFAYELDEVTEIIIDMLNECNNRYDLLMKNNVVDIYEYNKNRKEKLPYKVLFIEEIVLLLQDKKHVGMDNLKQLLSICRACGIFVFITTQRPSCDVLDSVAKACINNRIVFKVEDTKNSLIALDSEGAEKLKGRGNGILKIGSESEEFQGYFISSQQTKDLIKPFEIEKVNENNEIDLSFIDKL